MGQPQLRPRPLYGIGTVARLTGIKPDTLRIWERRYQLGASYKSPSGRRQYTQADLEHLQLVAALVSDGARIGEIASSERRTLEMLLRARSATADESIPEPKPRVLFLGEALCGWLDEHQGCLANVDARLAACEPGELQPEQIQELENVDAVVAEIAATGKGRLQALRSLAGELQASNVLVFHPGLDERGLTDIAESGFAEANYPPEPGFLACHLSLCAADKAVAEGSVNLGDLVRGRPRLFRTSELDAARGLNIPEPGASTDELSQLIDALADFEDHATEHPVQDWSDAAVHACVYTYAGQARWLMEKALELVLAARDPRA
ncbi:MAG: MerR family transcriptional regulator [Pseudomonadota bacterium]